MGDSQKYRKKTCLALLIILNYSMIFGIEGNWDTKIINISLNCRYSFLRGKVSPYIGGGPGLYYPDGTNSEFGANLSFGIDYPISQRFSIEVGSDYHMMFDSDKTRFFHAHAGLVFKF